MPSSAVHGTFGRAGCRFSMITARERSLPASIRGSVSASSSTAPWICPPRIAALISAPESKGTNVTSTPAFLKNATVWISDHPPGEVPANFSILGFFLPYATRSASVLNLESPATVTDDVSTWIRMMGSKSLRMWARVFGLTASIRWEGVTARTYTLRRAAGRRRASPWSPRRPAYW